MLPQQINIEDFAALRDYLRRTGRIEAGEEIVLTNLAGGVSNRTVLLARADESQWVLKQALAKLRVKVDWFSDPSRIAREALGMRWLEKLAPPGTITPLLFEDPGQFLLAMRAVPQPHENWKSQLLSGAIRRDAFEQFGRLLGTIQRNAEQHRTELNEIFGDQSFFESLRIEPYYAYAARQVPEAAEFLDGLIAATRRRRLSLVHGDYSPKNVLLRDGGIVLLDHEVIHFGDPAFDVGFAMTHFLSKARHLPRHRAQLLAGAAAFWSAYQQIIGDVPWAGDLEQACVHHTLGCMLARVTGRSPLEYLTEDERDAQRRQAVLLMRDPPLRIEQLFD